MAEEKTKDQATQSEDTETQNQAQEEEIEVPEKFKDLVEKIESLSVLDLAELVKILEKKFGVSAQTPALIAPPLAQAQAETEGGGEEKSEFDIVLKGIGEKKIEVIKVVRDITGKGLKEAKDLVDAAAKEPQVIKEGVKKEEAEDIKKKFESAGAEVELK